MAKYFERVSPLPTMHTTAAGGRRSPVPCPCRTCARASGHAARCPASQPSSWGRGWAWEAWRWPCWVGGCATTRQQQSCAAAAGPCTRQLRAGCQLWVLHIPRQAHDAGTHRSCYLTRLGCMHIPPCVRLHPVSASTCTARLHSYGTDVSVHVTIAPDPHPNPQVRM